MGSSAPQNLQKQKSENFSDAAGQDMEYLESILTSGNQARQASNSVIVKPPQFDSVDKWRQENQSHNIALNQLFQIQIK